MQGIRRQAGNLRRLHHSLWLLMLVLFFGGIIVLSLHPRLRALASDPQALASFIRSYGAYSSVACIVMQVVQVVISPIPGEITQIAAGYIFGIWQGLVLSFVGIMLGSTFNFYLVRFFGRPLIIELINAKTLENLDAVLKGVKGRMVLFLLFLLPGTPKDTLCYAAGATSLGYGEFLLLNSIGRLPSLLVSVLFGEEMALHRYNQMLVLVAVFVILCLAGGYLRHRYQNKRAQ